MKICSNIKSFSEINSSIDQSQIEAKMIYEMYKKFCSKRLQIDRLRQQYAAEIFYSTDFQLQQIGRKRSVVYIENFLTKQKENLLLGSVKAIIKILQRFEQKKYSSKIKQTVLCGWNFTVQIFKYSRLDIKDQWFILRIF